MAPPSADWMWGSDWSDEDLDETRSSSSSRFSSDSDYFPWKEEVDVVETSYGPLHVTICGDRSKPGLVTYHDIGLNHRTCFQGLFFCADTSSLLLRNFCVYHIDAPGHEADAEELPSPTSLSCEDLSDQVAELVKHLQLGKVMCLGVTAGAYILSLFALRHPTLVQGLILVSPVCRSASWAEWANTKVLSGILTLYGMSKFVKDALTRRFLSQEQTGFHGPASDSVISFRRDLDERNPSNVNRFLSAVTSREDLSSLLPSLSCPTLILVGDMSPFYEESTHMAACCPPHLAAWVEVPACGSLVTEERPHTMIPHVGAFLEQRFGYARLPTPSSCFPDLALPDEFGCSSLLTPSPSGSCPRSFSYEDLSLDALCVKLRPIRTRVGAATVAMVQQQQQYQKQLQCQQMPCQQLPQLHYVS